MADLSKLRFNGTDYNVKDASAPTRKFTNTYSKTGNLPISSDDTTQTAIGKLENNIIPKSEKGTANGVAELDANGKVPSSQLPSYVDDVLEYSAKSSFPATGESGKIYVDTTTNKTYRWSGSAYVEISESLALGETDSTAYRGDRGKAAYDHSQLTSGNPHNVTKSDVGLGNVGNFKAVSTVASQGLSDTEKSNARANIGAGTGNGTYSKPSGGIPKSDLASAVQTSLDQVNANKTNILSISETVNILKLSEFNNAFGMKISKSDTNPNTKVSYMFNAEGMTPAYMDFTGGSFNFGGFSSWKPVADNRPVGLNFDGSVAYELNHTDFSKKLDGTASDITDATKTINFMSEMPLMYVRRWEDENYNYIVFCEYQTNENYTADAFKNANGGIGSKLYLPMFKGSYVDGKLRSLAKQYWQNNADVQGAEAEWNAAVACGTGWQTWDWAKREYLSDLMTFITKSTDWKNKFGRGVTNRSTSNNNKFDGQPTGGYCSTSGDLTTWTADYHGQFYGVASTTSDKKHVTAFYVEDPYGNRWERTPGLELYNNVYRAKMSPPYALTDSASRAEYDNLGISAPAEGWVKTASTSIHGSVPVAVGASETTGYCSYFYKNASGVRLALFGGACNYGGTCGRYVLLSGAPSYSLWNVGASPCFVSP